MATILNYKALRLFSNYTDTVYVQGYTTVKDGGEGYFYWESTSTEPDNDGTIIKHTGSKPASKGAWKRIFHDAVSVSWFGAKNDCSTNSALQVKNAIYAAINTHAKVSFSSGTYKFDQVIEIDIPENFYLIIEGNGALIKATSQTTSTSSVVNLIRFFTSAGVDTQGTGIFIDNLDFDGSVIKPQFTEPDINAVKRMHALVSEDIFTVSIRNCHFRNIQGSGMKLFNFVYINLENLALKDVGGKFHLENENDSFGDGVYLCQTHLETSRPTRKQSYASISNCQISGYNPLTNGNFASRCGICIEGFGTLNSDHRVNLKLSNCSISGYDRTFHVEGIDAEVTADALKIENFQSFYLLALGRSESSFNNCHITNRLADNPNQVRLGTGGIITYPSTLPNHMAFNHCQINVNGDGVFIGQLEFIDTVLDYGNHDIFFENSIISLNKSSFINIPHNLSKGFNFYACTFSAINSTIKGYKNGNDNSGGIFHFEDLDLQSFENNTIIDTRLVLTFRSATARLAQILSNKIYRNSKGSGVRMDSLIFYANVPQVKMSNNNFYIEVATASDQEPIYKTYGVLSVTYNNDREHLHIIDSGKTSSLKL